MSSICSCHTLRENDHLAELVSSCQRVSAEWETLGTLLGILPNTIKTIRKERMNASSECLTDLFVKWLKRDSDHQPLPSWRALCNALEVIDLQLSQELGSKHSCDDCTSCTSPKAAQVEDVLMLSNEIEELRNEIGGLLNRIQELEQENDLFHEVKRRSKEQLDAIRDEHTRTRQLYQEILGKLKRISEEELLELGKEMMIKAKEGDVNEVSKLALQGADINYTDEKKQTPLHVASEAGHTDVVRVLLSHGAFVDVKDNNDLTSLHLASKRGHTDVVCTLLSYGAAKVDIEENKSSQTPLHFATIGGYTEVVQALLMNRASSNIKADYKQTPLHRASENGHVEIVKLLIKCKAAVDVKNQFGNTPLHLASRKGTTEIVKLLLESGQVEFNDLNGESRSPLHEACQKNRLDVVQLLLSYKASITMKDQHDQSPLHTALLQRHTNIAMLLLSAGADITSRDKYGQTPILIAVVLKLEDILKFFQSTSGVVKEELEKHELPPTWKALLDDEKEVRIIYTNLAGDKQHEHPKTCSESI